MGKEATGGEAESVKAFLISCTDMVLEHETCLTDIYGCRTVATPFVLRCIL